MVLGYFDRRLKVQTINCCKYTCNWHCMRQTVSFWMWFTKRNHSTLHSTNTVTNLILAFLLLFIQQFFFSQCMVAFSRLFFCLISARQIFTLFIIRRCYGKRMKSRKKRRLVACVVCFVSFVLSFWLGILFAVCISQCIKIRPFLTLDLSGVE